MSTNDKPHPVPRKLQSSLSFFWKIHLQGPGSDPGHFSCSTHEWILSKIYQILSINSKLKLNF